MDTLEKRRLVLHYLLAGDTAAAQKLSAEISNQYRPYSKDGLTVEGLVVAPKATSGDCANCGMPTWAWERLHFIIDARGRIGPCCIPKFQKSEEVKQ